MTTKPSTATELREGAEAIAETAPLVAHKSLAAALIAALADLSVVETARTATIPTKTSGTYTYKYADIADVVKLTRPRLAAHGVVALTPVHDLGDGLACTVVLLHESGERMDLGPFPFPHGKDAQATGSMVTYHRRYALVAALGMAAGDDDDGASAAPRRRESAPQEPPEVALLLTELADLGEVGDKIRASLVTRSGESDARTALLDEGWRNWLRSAIDYHHSTPDTEGAE